MQTIRKDESKSTELDKWWPLCDFLKLHPQFNEGQIRWLMRNRDRNGFNSVARKIGRNLYIHEGLFADWIINKPE